MMGSKENLKLTFVAVALIPLLTVACGKLTAVSPQSSSVNKQNQPTASQPAGSSSAGTETSAADEQKSTTHSDQDYVVSLVTPPKEDLSNAIVEAEDYSDLIPEVDLKVPEKRPSQSSQQPTPKESSTNPPPKSTNPPAKTEEAPAPSSPPKKEDPKKPQPAKPNEGPSAQPEKKPKQENQAPPQSSQQPKPSGPARTSVKREAINYVDDGSLVDPASLLQRQYTYREAPPFIVIAPGRNRFYGTTDLIEAIDHLAQYAKSISNSLRLMVSDLSGPNGGPLFRWDEKSQTYKKDNRGNPIKSHESHQNGLDADISYLTMAPDAQPFLDVRQLSDINSVLNLEAQFKLFKQAVSTDMVEAFFVDPVIKKEMCRQAFRMGAFTKDQEDKTALETLRRLVVEPHWHFNHFHMRLKCDRSRQSACLQRPDFTPKDHGCIFTKKESGK